MSKSDSPNADFFTGKMQLASVGIVVVGDSAVEQAKLMVEIFKRNNAIEQIGVLALVKVNTEVYDDGEEIGKMFPKKQKQKVIACCAKNTTALRELEKDEEFARKKRGIWLPKIKTKLIPKVVEMLEGHQVGIVVVYMGAGAHAVIAREIISLLKEKYAGLHFVVVLCKPYHHKKCEVIHANNKKFVVETNTLSLEFQSRLDDKTFKPQDYINNKSLFTLINERKTATNESAPDMLGAMELDKHFVQKTLVMPNPLYAKQGFFRDRVGNHRDIVVDAIARGFEEIGVCERCFYTISGHATDGIVQDAIIQVGKGDEDFRLNYRLLPTTDMGKLIIGKFEPC